MIINVIKLTGYGTRAFSVKAKMTSSTPKEASHIGKFDGKNFPLWKFTFWLLLEEHALESIVDGTELIPIEVILSTEILLTYIIYQHHLLLKELSSTC